MMQRWYVRNRDTIVPLLGVGAIALLLANLIQHGYLTASLLATNKDALSALQSVVQVVVLTAGAIFSYYRFFRGRTFVSRAEINIVVQVLSAGEDQHLHSVIVQFKNLGTVSIWEPLPVVNVQLIGPEGVVSETWRNWRAARVTDHQNARDLESTIPLTVVDSGETVTFNTYHEVSKRFWAAEYEVFVKDSDGNIWKRAAMVSNTPAAA
jgi:hypothetical protein